ncbi:hypothetical protein SBV1_1570046 [Verrucomicrobia bacterium]|nr:hypothetical protein SBV1_1570046 [Verrucomicrobiota bacterium]
MYFKNRFFHVSSSFQTTCAKIRIYVTLSAATPGRWWPVRPETNSRRWMPRLVGSLKPAAFVIALALRTAHLTFPCLL